MSGKKAWQEPVMSTYIPSRKRESRSRHFRHSLLTPIHLRKRPARTDSPSRPSTDNRDSSSSVSGFLLQVCGISTQQLYCGYREAPLPDQETQVSKEVSASSSKE